MDLSEINNNMETERDLPMHTQQNTNYADKENSEKNLPVVKNDTSNKDMKHIDYSVSMKRKVGEMALDVWTSKINMDNNMWGGSYQVHSVEGT